MSIDESTPDRDEPTYECILLRAEQFYWRLRQWGFSEAVAEHAVGVATIVAVRAIQSGKAATMSKPRRTVWMWRVALNAALRQSVRESIYATVDLDTLHLRCWDSDEAISRAALALRDAFKSLPERHQVVLILRVVEDLSFSQVAKAMKVSIGSVRWHLAKAICGLREALADYRERPFAEKSGKALAHADLL